MQSSLIFPMTIGQFIPYSYKMKKADIFEQFFVEAMTEKVEASTMSHSEFGRRVFGEDSGARLWRATREKSRKRSVSIGEASLMAEALGMDFPSLVWEIVQDGKRRGILT